MSPDLKAFIDALESSLKERYYGSESGDARPADVLLAVLNAVADARQATEPKP